MTGRKLVALVLCVGTAAALGWARPRPAFVADRVSDTAQWLWPDGLAAVAGQLAGFAGWLALAWLTAGLALMSAARLPGAVGRSAERMAGRTMPAVLRRGLACGLTEPGTSTTPAAHGRPAAVTTPPPDLWSPWPPEDTTALWTPPTHRPALCPPPPEPPRADPEPEAGPADTAAAERVLRDPGVAAAPAGPAHDGGPDPDQPVTEVATGPAGPTHDGGPDPDQPATEVATGPAGPTHDGGPDPDQPVAAGAGRPLRLIVTRPGPDAPAWPTTDRDLLPIGQQGQP